MNPSSFSTFLSLPYCFKLFQKNKLKTEDTHFWSILTVAGGEFRTEFPVRTIKLSVRRVCSIEFSVRPSMFYWIPCQKDDVLFNSLSERGSSIEFLSEGWCSIEFQKRTFYLIPWQNEDVLLNSLSEWGCSIEFPVRTSRCSIEFQNEDGL